VPVRRPECVVAAAANTWSSRRRRRFGKSRPCSSGTGSVTSAGCGDRAHCCRSARLAAPRGSRVGASRSGRSGRPDRGVPGAAS
jgi:hypothetical protein